MIRFLHPDRIQAYRERHWKVNDKGNTHAWIVTFVVFAFLFAVIL